MGLTTSAPLTVFNKLFCRSRKSARILLAGIDFAGKTTVLYRLKLGKVIKTIPTASPITEFFEYKNISFEMCELSGGGKFRGLWRFYTKNTDAVIFVIDSNERRIGDPCDELHSLLEELSVTEPIDFKDKIVLILANKQDLPNPMSTAEIIDKLKLNALKRCKWYIQATSVTEETDDGLYKGLDWLSNELLGAKK